MDKTDFWLKETTEKIRNEAKNDSERSLKSIVGAETIISGDYEGRFIFELIQNARDANVYSKNGKILIKIEKSTLFIANTGSPFTKEGVDSITTINESTKKGMEYIGHKGIGFVSVIEITDFPKIIFDQGTLFFSKKVTLEYFKENRNTNIDINKLPLFHFPYCDQERRIQDNPEFRDYTTLIELPIKEGYGIENIINRFNRDISHETILLLGNLEEIIFQSENEKINYVITKELGNQKFKNKNNVELQLIKITKNQEETKEFILLKKYIPPLDKEKEDIEIIIAFQYKNDEIIILDNNENVKGENANNNGKLYVFYPTECYSGLRYIVHSYFEVISSRRDLRESKKNKYILDNIADFVSKEVLEFIKENFPKQILDILRYNKGGILDDMSKLFKFHDKLKECLLDKKFIWDGKGFHKIQNILLSEQKDIDLFGHNLIDDIYLINIEDLDVKKWLEDEFGAKELNQNILKEEIERICQQKLDNKDYAFFEELYLYLKEKNWKIPDKKILVSEDRDLVSGEEVYIFYRPKEDLILPDSFNRDLALLNKNIELSSIRELKNYVGLREYNFENIISHMNNVSEKKAHLKFEFLQFLFETYHNEPSSREINYNIIPSINKDGERRWVSPKNTYIRDNNLIEIYWEDNCLFVDDESIKKNVSNYEKEKWDNFFLKIGVWGIPKIKYVNYPEDKWIDDIKREKRIYAKYVDRRQPGYSINGDIILDKPKNFTKYFFDSIIMNWEGYSKEMGHFEIKIKSKYGESNKVPGYHNIYLSEFLDSLTKWKWIPINFRGRIDSYSPSEVIGIDRKHPRLNKIKNSWPMLVIDNEKYRDVINDLGASHLSIEDSSNYIEILNKIYEKNPNPPYDSEFIGFYDEILRCIYEYYSNIEWENNKRYFIEQLKSVKILCKKNDKELSFAYPSDILYIDDTKTYANLVGHCKELKEIPTFTNNDRHGFCIIAKHFGNKFSDRISKEPILEGEIYYLDLLDFLSSFNINEKKFYRIILLAENQIKHTLDERHIKKKLSMVKFVFIKDLKIKISFNDKEINLGQKYYLEKNEENIQAYLNDNLSNNELFHFLKELFEEITEYELNYFDSVIKDYFSHSGNEQKEFLKNRINVDRIEELEDEDFEESELAEKNVDDQIPMHGIFKISIPTTDNSDKNTHLESVDNDNLEEHTTKKLIETTPNSLFNRFGITERKNRQYTSEAIGRGQRYNAPIEIGKVGEKYVLSKQKDLLIKMGKEELSKKVENVSTQNKGYDIKSYNENGEEIYIEVKTTTNPKNWNIFEITWHELEVAERERDKYYICRVIRVYDTWEFFVIQNPLQDIKIEKMKVIEKNFLLSPSEAIYEVSNDSIISFKKLVIN